MVLMIDQTGNQNILSSTVEVGTENANLSMTYVAVYIDSILCI